METTIQPSDNEKKNSSEENKEDEFSLENSWSKQRRTVLRSIQGSVYIAHNDAHSRSQDQMDSASLQNLPLATEAEVRSAPTVADEVIVVEAYLQIRKIRKMDAVASDVNGSFVVHLLWNNSSCVGKRVANQQDLWRPSLQVLNRDQLTETVQCPQFYPKSGDVRMEIMYDGSFGNEADLRYFPFDMDSISILVVAERGSSDNFVRLAWQKNRRHKEADHSASSVTPSYIERQMQEWKFYPHLTSVRRMRQQPGICGDATGFEVRCYLARRWQFYMFKISSVIWGITGLSWFVFGFDVDKVSSYLNYCL